MEREQDIQNRLMSTLARQQGDVAKHINDYLQAASEWQGTYNYLASSTTGLQGLLTNWLEAREIYEKADLAFALANLGVGGIKLGFKAYKFFTNSAVAGGEAAAGAGGLAGAADEALAAGAGATDEALAAGAGATDEAAALASGETQAFNRTLVPPGQQPNAPGFGGFAEGTSAVSGSQAASDAVMLQREVARWEAEVAQTRSMLENMQKSGAPQSLIDDFKTALDDLLETGPPTSLPPPPISATAQMVSRMDDGLVAAARQAGINVDDVASAAADLEAAEIALMRAIAESRGWHDIPKWAGDPITNILINARKILAGADDVRINPKDLEILQSLRTYVESRGLNFTEYLATAAGEIGVAGKEAFKAGGLEFSGKTFEVFEGIVKYYDPEDIDILLKALDAAGDATKLRNTVNPVTQASLNGLGRAAQAGGGGCGALDAGLGLQGMGGTLEGSANIAGNNGGSGPPAGTPTDAELQNVLYGTGELGKVGLGNVVDQFGVTDRFTAGQSYGRAMMGELWEFFTSPSATTASIYYTLEAQDEVLNLFQNEGSKLTDLGMQVGSASRALGRLRATLEQAGLTESGFLGGQGPAELRRALGQLEEVYDSASDDWKERNKELIEERRKHINEKLAALAETVEDLNALAERLEKLQKWLDSLRLNPDGSLRRPLDLFNPIIYVRLGSISLYLRAMGADAFGLTSDVPFRLVAPDAPEPVRLEPHRELTPKEVFEENRARLEEKWRQFEEASEVEFDPDLDAWLDNLPPPPGD